MSEQPTKEITLVREGRPAAVIVLAPDPAATAALWPPDKERGFFGYRDWSVVYPPETGSGPETCPQVEPLVAGDPEPASRQSANELVLHLQRMSDAVLPVILEGMDTGGLLPVRIGPAADAGLDDWMREQAEASDAFALVVEPAGVQLRGLRPVGTQHAACELLAQLGVRWHEPLRDGWVIPARRTVTLALQRTVKIPPTEYRCLPRLAPRSTVYTLRMKCEHLDTVRRSPFVRPTPSADADFILGYSHGWEGDPAVSHRATHAWHPNHPIVTNRHGLPALDPKVPAQPLHGYRITAPQADGARATVVLTDGNHSEYTGSWSFHGMIEFLLGDDPLAADLRRRADFYVYPLLNPDGRYLFSRVSNPELVAAGWLNHNRAWDTAGLFATIDVLAPAMRYDTRGQVDVFLDFHSNGTSIYCPDNLNDSPFVRAMSRQDPAVLPKVFTATGTTNHWARHADGLNATWAFTLEHSSWEPLERCLAIGRSYARALHAILALPAEDSQRPEKPPVPVPVTESDLPPVSPPATLLQAAAQGDLAAALRFLQAGADANARNAAGQSALHLAVERGIVELTLALLAHGACVKAANPRGWAPLHTAARFGDSDSVALLLEQGADVQAANSVGDTPLHLAAAYNRPAIVSQLLAHGADPNRTGQWNRTPVQWTERMQDTRLAR